MQLERWDVPCGRVPFVTPSAGAPGGAAGCAAPKRKKSPRSRRTARRVLASPGSAANATGTMGRVLWARPFCYPKRWSTWRNSRPCSRSCATPKFKKAKRNRHPPPETQCSPVPPGSERTTLERWDASTGRVPFVTPEKGGKDWKKLLKRQKQLLCFSGTVAIIEETPSPWAAGEGAGR